MKQDKKQGPGRPKITDKGEKKVGFTVTVKQKNLKKAKAAVKALISEIDK